MVSFEGLIGLSPEDVAQTRFEIQGDELTLFFPGDAFVTQLQRQEAVPARCEETLGRDSQSIFDFVWETFDEYYAFFDLRGVDWAAEFARQLPQVGTATDDEALFSLLSDLLSPIDDGHVFLENSDNFFSPAADSEILLDLQRGFEAQNEITDFQTYVDAFVDQFGQNIVSRLDVESLEMDGESPKEQGELAWGTIDDGSIGYISIFAMQGYVTDDNGETLGDVSAAEDLAAARSAMDMAMADLANTSSLIIDVRLNDGGRDSIALEFAQRFVD